MTLRTIASVLTVLMLALLVAAPVSAGGDTEITAGAQLHNADGEVVGEATFTQVEGGVRIEAEVSHLEPGLHGIHIHETGQCDPPDFKSAGGHFNPEGRQHGLDSAEGPHAGDLPNLEVGEDGSGTYETTTDRVTLTEGEASLFDDDGSALVIHAGEDDQVTDPTGDSGDRVACGVIEQQDDQQGEMPEEMPETGAGGLVPPATIPVGNAAAGLVMLVGASYAVLRRR